MHPEFRYPELHSDIALIELGRRVEFKLEEFGDTPTCLDKGLDLSGKVATAQVQSSSYILIQTRLYFSFLFSFLPSFETAWIEINIETKRSCQLTVLFFCL